MRAYGPWDTKNADDMEGLAIIRYRGHDSCREAETMTYVSLSYVPGLAVRIFFGLRARPCSEKKKEKYDSSEKDLGWIQRQKAFDFSTLSATIYLSFSFLLVHIPVRFPLRFCPYRGFAWRFSPGLPVHKLSLPCQTIHNTIT